MREPNNLNKSTTQKKKKKKRSRKKKAAPSESVRCAVVRHLFLDSHRFEITSIPSHQAGAGAAASAPAGAVDAVAVESLAEDMSKKVQIGSTNPADNAKQIKKIKKKIRQIKSLQVRTTRAILKLKTHTTT